MKRTLMVLTAILAIAGSASAQQPQGGGGDPFAKYFYPPEFVMQHQSEIGLTDAQRQSLVAAMQGAQGKFVEAQFKLSSEAEKLVKLVSGPVVDEAQTLDQVDKVLMQEREVKRAQVSLIVKIKNILTPAQQAKLNTLR